MTASGSIAVCVASWLLGISPGATEQAAALLARGDLSSIEARRELEAGVRALNSFNDAAARQLFNHLLAQDPPSSIAAKAHVYLGIIDFNRLNTDGAREEFRRAVETDPAVEPPREMSPKARLVFAEARRRVTVELTGPAAQPQLLPEEAPAARAPMAVGNGDSLDISPAAQTPSPPADAGHSHKLSYVLGAVAVAGLALAIIGVVQVESFELLQGRLSNPTSYTQYARDSSAVVSEGPGAQAWGNIAIGSGAIALGMGTWAGFAW